MTLSYLWKNRERPAPLSRRWYIVWLKRSLTAGSLLRIFVTNLTLGMRGAIIGDLSIVGRCRFEGPRGRLTLGVGSVVDDGCHIVLHECVDIGDRVVINRNVVILTASHGIRDPQWRTYRRPVRIESYAWIAMGAMILPGVTIGRGAVIGAGAVVRRDVRPFSIVTGNPATETDAVRVSELDYLPTRYAVPFEAWLGRP